MEAHMRVPQGEFALRRLPSRANDVLRAWDAADEYLLFDLASRQLAHDACIFVLNDSFGALGVALHQFRPIALSDSWLSQQATRLNLEANGISLDRVKLLSSLQLPCETIDYLLIKVPKTLALLEYQLIVLRPWLSDRTQVIAAAMVKNLPASVRNTLERLVGPVTMSLSRKKARLIYAQKSTDTNTPANPYPVYYRLENSDFVVSNHANVFSRDRLDIGTRFLLQHLPANSNFLDFIDLGCGNGVVGMMLAKAYPNSSLRFIDESFMALASAEDNIRRAFPEKEHVEFIPTDCLNGIASESADCIVCNPPFHQEHSVGDQIAWQMFKQSRRVLRRDGELRVIGNRHLAYHNRLKKIFGRYELVASNRKFVILSAVKK